VSVGTVFCVDFKSNCSVSKLIGPTRFCTRLDNESRLTVLSLQTLTSLLLVSIILFSFDCISSLSTDLILDFDDDDDLLVSDDFDEIVDSVDKFKIFALFLLLILVTFVSIVALFTSSLFSSSSSLFKIISLSTAVNNLNSSDFFKLFSSLLLDEVVDTSV
jgi:hypothetical protein